MQSNGICYHVSRVMILKILSQIEPFLQLSFVFIHIFYKEKVFDKNCIRKTITYLSLRWTTGRHCDYYVCVPVLMHKERTEDKLAVGSLFYPQGSRDKTQVTMCLYALIHLVAPLTNLVVIHVVKRFLLKHIIT